MLLINLFGGPGAGKSTGAAYIFSKLKMAGVNAELVTEFAKDKVWEGNKEVFKNQAYIFGKQYFKISRCADKVDVIITDSPLLLSIVYNDNPVLGDSFNETVKNVIRRTHYDETNPAALHPHRSAGADNGDAARRVLYQFRASGERQQ